jgi:hypothetical protein
MINNTNIPQDGQTNSLLLCLVSPNYAKILCDSHALDIINIQEQSGSVLRAVLHHYSKEHRVFKTVPKMTKETLFGIIDEDLKDYADNLMDYRDSKAGKERLISMLPSVAELFKNA